MMGLGVKGVARGTPGPSRVVEGKFWSVERESDRIRINNSLRQV